MAVLGFCTLVVCYPTQSKEDITTDNQKDQYTEKISHLKLTFSNVKRKAIYQDSIGKLVIYLNLLLFLFFYLKIADTLFYLQRSYFIKDKKERLLFCRLKKYSVYLLGFKQTTIHFSKYGIV